MKIKALVILLLICLYPFGLFGQFEFSTADFPQDTMQMSAMALAAGDSLGLDAADIPNVFTPNGDNLNDYFEVETPAGKVYDFRIFTRAGTQIYQSNSPRIFWDGRDAAGHEVSAGIYYYVIELSEDSAPKGLNGFVYIFR